MRTVTLYGRPGCHLCEEALEIVERVRTDVPFELDQLDIEDDDALLRAYLERIPVIAVDGEELFELFVDEDALRAAVSSASP